jgi:transcriptional regulator GlxA family with amidase domain
MKLKEIVVTEVALVIYPDCQLAAIYGLTDLFRLAGQWANRDEPGAAKPSIRVSHWRMEERQMLCVFDSHPNENHQIKHVIVPPSLVEPDKMTSMRVAADWMVEQHRHGVTLASVCAGAFVLAETGLIDQRLTTTHWAFAEALKKRYPKVNVAADNMVIDDGDIMTAGGILAWADLGLTIVSKILGAGTMLATARFLLIDPPRQHQSTYRVFIPRFDHGDAAILAIQHHIHAHLAEPHSFVELASQAGLTERTFLRRFVKATGHKPTDYLQQTRIMKARDALELTNRTIDDIAYSVGYSDPTAFRKVFLKIAGLLPTHYRQRFAIALP